MMSPRLDILIEKRIPAPSCLFGVIKHYPCLCVAQMGLTSKKFQEIKLRQIFEGQKTLRRIISRYDEKRMICHPPVKCGAGHRQN
jgi:hypothetical protein